jgi:hypothetical protein
MPASCRTIRSGPGLARPHFTNAAPTASASYSGRTLEVAASRAVRATRQGYPCSLPSNRASTARSQPRFWYSEESSSAA